MTQEIMALCGAMGAPQDREELLLPLALAVERQLAGRLREGVAAEECGPAFPLAAAMLVMDRLSGMTDGGVTAFTAGDLTIRRETGKALSRQAEELLAPWLKNGGGFAFQGAEG